MQFLKESKEISLRDRAIPESIFQIIKMWSASAQKTWKTQQTITGQYNYVKLSSLNIKLMRCCSLLRNRVVVCSRAELTGSRIQWFKSTHKWIQDKKVGSSIKTEWQHCISFSSLHFSDSKRKKGKFPVYNSGKVFPYVYIDNVVYIR